MLTVEEGWLIICVILFLFGIFLGFIAGCRYSTRPFTSPSFEKLDENRQHKLILITLSLLSASVVGIWLVIVLIDICKRSVA